MYFQTCKNSLLAYKRKADTFGCLKVWTVFVSNNLYNFLLISKKGCLIDGRSLFLFWKSV